MSDAKTEKTTAEKPPIYLLDSMAFIFRAYHAMQRQRPMSTRTGIPTAATYVFVNMINKLRKDFQPHYLAAVYDLSGPVFRDERAKEMKGVKKFNIKTQQFEVIDYAGYKANRAEMPQDLAQQLPFIRRALEAFRIPILSYEGFEADDVIGTLSSKLSELGHKVFVVSSDKDMMQLVNNGVSILNPTKDNLILDPAGVENILGVPPERVIDVMALRGDAIDNIPGAPGIGDKGSVELIQQFGTVEAALDRAEEVKKKTYRESLQNNRENILLSKELVTIHTGVPIEFSIEDMLTQPIDNAASRELFSELEFTTLLKELAPAVDNTPIAYITKPTHEQIASLLTEARTIDKVTGKPHGLALAIFEDARAIAEEIAAEPSEDSAEPEPPPAENLSLFGAPEATKPGAPGPDSETWVSTEASTDAACQLGLAVDSHTAIEVPLDAPGIKEALLDAELPKDVHDLKAVHRALQPHGITLAGVRDDVMLLSYLVNPTHGSHTLADVTARFTNRALAQVTKGVVSKDLLPEASNAVQRLAPILRAEIETSNVTNVYDTIDLPLVAVLLRMEQAGVRIDPTVLNDMSNRLVIEIDNLAERIYAEAGSAMGSDSPHRFNINSPKQLGDVLFNKMNLPKPMKYGKGKVVSTAQDVLEELAESHTTPALVLEYRQFAKLKSTYLDQLPNLADREGRIHTTFNQVGTATGRLSSTNPNLQNIPVRTAVGREIRAAFIAAPGNVLMSADYSQIELRLMAHFSQDPLLLDAYRTGKDIHTLTAAEVFGVDAATMDKETRNRAKAVNFGIVYGISPFGLAAQLGIDQKTAKQYIETYFERYAGVRRFIDETLETVRRDQAVRTYFGRVRPIPDIQSRNPNMRGFAERTAVNTPLQGTAADLIKLAMLRIDQALRDRKLKSQMTLQVHDELLFDVVPEEAEELQKLVKHEMEHVAEFTVPIIADVGIGQNWRDIK
ncbi:DNA polymerase I [Edaphobacter dinghuensis]|uniref:DNA polymerase I n=1 Tax=Edaphobacter dinghuensis TaxID=1560005 RepID=A0A917HHY5_9BACT|nr:DNA polymerase I [Edaphobacter dinghuensis]GGG79166.1 DNA polymerase [Edaphobacter dinghuensis]